ncbi:MAG: MG2 domain-containing protein, partial [Anaerolineales bacterium]
GKTYTITVSPSVISADGRNLLVDPIVYSFHTREYYDWSLSPSFGIGSDVQVVDAAGLRKVQFGMPPQATVQFELYPCRTDPFLRLYTGKYGDNGLRFSTDLLPVPEPDVSPSATWSFTDSGNDENPVHETVIPESVKPGLYVMNLTFDGRLYDQLLVALSRNVLVVKQSTGELSVWMTDFRGKSVASAELRLYSNRGELIRRATTDRNGMGRIAVPAGVIPMLVTAQAAGTAEGDVTIAGLDWQYRTADPNSWTLPVKTARRYQAYIYTERPIYRPGQTVYFKAVIRKDNDAAYALLPAGTPVAVTVRDGRGTPIQGFELKTNGFGSIEGSFPLGADAVLGNYTIETVVDGESETLAFAVEDYRKPDFGVTLAPLDPAQANNVVSGDTFMLEGTAEYFFGEPVANATVSAEVYYLQPSYRWSDSEAFWSTAFVWYDARSIRPAFDPRTDSEGKIRITLDIGEIAEEEGWGNWRNSSIRATYALQVTVDDGSHQSISATYILNAYSASEVIDIENGGYVRRPGQTFSVRAGARTIAGEPVSGRELTLALNRWDWDGWEYRSAGAFPLATDAQGNADQALTLSSGYYQLVLEGEDGQGRAMTDKTWICVFSSTDDWFTRSEAAVQIAADRDSYQPDQTAQFMIESSFSGPALLTFERGHVLRSLPIQLTAPLTIVEAKLRPEDAPNVFVTVNAWQPDEDIQYDEYDFEYWGSNRPESHLRLATMELRVDAGASALRVGISTDRESYAPGDSMKVTIGVTDAGGNPVLAEVSLAAVDESIFTLQAEQSPDIFSAFYGVRSRSVRTYDSMSPDRIIISPGGRGGGGGGGPSTAFGLRSDFQDTAAWFPSLKTGTNGRVTVEVKLPDNLTSWRLTAKAVTRNSLVGQAQKNITVKKELLVRAVPPRILTTGDQAEITAFVHNYGDSQREVDVTLEAEGLRLLGSASQSISLDPGEASPVRWQVEVVGVNGGAIVVSAESRDGLADGVRLPLSIQPAASTSVFTQSGEFQGSARIVVPLPPIIPGTGRATLQLSRTMSGSILGGLEYLTGYPYGCIEQTMSRALPNAVVGRAGALLGLDPGMSARLDPLIRASIQRLVNFQHRDGGWGWWYDDASTDYQTAWVLFGLAQLEAAGYPAGDSVMEDAVRYLKDDMQKMDIRTRAFALYSMALTGRGDPEAARSLADSHVNELDPFSQAALALGLQAMGDGERAREVLAAVESHGIRNQAVVYWPQGTSDGEYTRKTMASTLRTTALVLDAFVTIDPGSEMIPGAVKYLLSRRQGRYGWGTTNETAFSILALTDYLVLEGKKAGESAYKVNLNGQLMASGALRMGSNATTVVIPLDSFQPGINILTITSTGSAALYYDLAAEYSLQEIPSAPSGPIHVSRRYLDPGTGKPLTDIRAGQLVNVELTVETDEDAAYILVEDHLPGGLEALNENLNSTPYYTGDEALDYYAGPGRWEDLGYNFKEIRNDRVAFFITDLRHGKHTITYLARAMTAGEFLALPVQVCAMYDLDLWGRSAADRLIILRGGFPLA